MASWIPVSAQTQTSVWTTDLVGYVCVSQVTVSISASVSVCIEWITDSVGCVCVSQVSVSTSTSTLVCTELIKRQQCTVAHAPALSLCDIRFFFSKTWFTGLARDKGAPTTCGRRRGPRHPRAPAPCIFCVLTAIE